MSAVGLTKEQKEKLVDERISRMREKNALLEQRYKEIEDDKKQAVQNSSMVQMQEVKSYVMTSTPQRNDRPRLPANSENEESKGPKVNSHFSQRLGEMVDPPPVPESSFLSDPERDNKEFAKSKQTDFKYRENEGNNFRESYRARYRGSQASAFTNERGNYGCNENGNHVTDFRMSYSPRSLYRGQGRRINLNSTRSTAYNRGGTCGDQKDWRNEDYRQRGRAISRSGYNFKQNEYDSWKTEQDGYDKQRIARSKNDNGQWRREWDNHKKDYENDVSIEHNPDKYEVKGRGRMLYSKGENIYNSTEYKYNNDSRSNQQTSDNEEERPPSPEVDSSFAAFLANRAAEDEAIDNRIKLSRGQNFKRSPVASTIISTRNNTSPLIENSSLIITNMESKEEVKENLPGIATSTDALNEDLSASFIPISVKQDLDCSYINDLMTDVPFIAEKENDTRVLPTLDEDDFSPLGVSTTADGDLDIPPLAVVATADTVFAFETIDSGISQQNLPPVSCSTFDASLNEEKVSTSPFCTEITDVSAALNDLSIDSDTVVDEKESLSFQDAIGSNATSETSSIYEPVDENFSSPIINDCTAFSSDASFTTANISSESALTNEESNDMKQQLNLLEEESLLQCSTSNEKITFDDSKQFSA